MKPVRPLLSLLVVCLAASQSCLPAAHAQEPSASPAASPAPSADPAHLAAADEVLQAMNIERLFGGTADRVATQLDRIIDGAARQLGNKPEVADFQRRMRDDSHALFKKQFNWEVLKPSFVQDYADVFSTQELKDLTAFYKSPLGQKLITKQPEVSERMGKASQERARQVFQLIISRVQDESAKLQAAMATPSPSPGASPAADATAPTPSDVSATKPSGTTSPAPAGKGTPPTP